MPDNNDQQQQPPDLAGYPSTDELVKGYRASSTEAQRQRQRAEQLEARLSQIEQQFTRQSVPQRANPADTLTEWGIPVNVLDEYVNQRVTEGVSRAFEPLNGMAKGRNAMLTRYPDYQKFEADVANYVQSDPEVAQSYEKLFAADPAGAMEYAFLKFGEQKRGETTNGNGNGAATAHQQQARSEAQIPSNRRGDARTMPAAQEQENLTRSWESYQKTGNPAQYVKARLKGVIPDSFLNQ